MTHVTARARFGVVAMLLVALVGVGSCTSSGSDVEVSGARPTPAEPVVPTTAADAPVEVGDEPAATPEPSATLVPTQTATAAPTATPQPTATVTPTASPTPEPTPEATATPTPTPTGTAETATAQDDSSDSDIDSAATPDPERTQVPTDYDGAVRAVRTAGGHMLTVRSDGPPYEVVTPCYNLATVADGLAIEGPVDVLIDPGHGGDETGAVAPNGLVEAALNLRVAELVRDQLVDLGYSVLLTRYSDHRMAIQARTELANALAPRILVSIHHNGGFPEPVDRPGTEVFFQRDDADAQRLAGVLFEELQVALADYDIDWVGTEWLGVSWRANERGTDLYGMLRRTTSTVSVLTEAMYMTNEAEAELLARPEVIQAEADALVRGIVRYFETSDAGSGFLDGLIFRGDLGPGGGTDGCVDPDLN